MKCVLGIDIGGSTTKIVGYRNGDIFSPFFVKASDPRASLFGAFGQFLDMNGLELTDILSVMITGVGASSCTKDIFGIDTHIIDEFQAVGRGGLFLSKLQSAVVVSMGTGTAFVSADKNGVSYIGGTGIGGGTLIGLSNRILNVRNFADITETAESGDLKNVDLHIGDISSSDIHHLTETTTASNFGKINDLATNGDLALGIINLVFQTVGVMAALSAKTVGTKNIVLTGNLTSVSQAPAILNKVKDLYGVEYIIPEHSEYATAMGAALMYKGEI